MNLKELKRMIAEEYSAYMEQADAAEPAVAVSDDDIDVDGGVENPEETLKSIYDMLKSYFEGGEGAAGAAGGDVDVDADLGDMADDLEDDAAAEKEDEEDEALQERFKKLANIIKG